MGVSTIHGFTIIKYYHLLTIFETKLLFYEIEGLEYDLLIAAKIDAEKGIIEYNGK